MLNGFDEMVESRINFLGYLRDLEYYIQMHPECHFINLSREGARIAGVVYEDTNE